VGRYDERMKLRLFPRRPAGMNERLHAVAKVVVTAITLVALAFGFVVAEYDDAPGAVGIFPLVAYGLSVAIYSAFLCFRKTQ
jgi:hypothetical protein